MTLTRYQIRNEYGLADKDLYQSSAHKDDPEAFLEAASMAGLVGVLRQLGDLAEFAAEVFHCLHEEMMTTAARGHGLAFRLQHLESQFPSFEIPILSQTDHSTFYYNPGLQWHSSLLPKQDLISPRNLPHCIIDSYEESRAPPQLFLLDKFDVAGSGSCLKRYSDPSLLKRPTPSATSKLIKDDRPRKSKKKGSHTTSKEAYGDSRTSHAKLHQLFFLEHVENEQENPEFHVRLKRRQLNGPLFNSSSGTSYMEKFLKNSSPYCERVHGTLDQSSPAIETEVTVCSVREELQTPSLVYPNSGDTSKYNEMEIEGGSEICLERSSSCCKEINETDTPVSMESEAKEADSDDRACCELGFPGFGQTQICTNAEVTQTEDLSHFSSVLHHSPKEGESSSLLCTDLESSSLEACEVVEDGRDPVLTISPEAHPEYLLKLTQVSYDASDGGTNVDHSQHVFSVDTGSEISLSALVEDQFSSVTNQEVEALEPEDISSETGHSIPDSKSSLKGTPSALESDFLLPNPYISTFDDLEDKTNSQDISSTNPKQFKHISTSEISSENGTLMSDTPRELHTRCSNLSASSSCEDVLASPDLAEISSHSGQEDPQTMSIVADDDSSAPEEPIPDTPRLGTCFAGDVDHDNHTGLDNKADTMPEIDLETISEPQENLLGTEECLSPECCLQTQNQGKESPSETGSANPITASVESLPTQNGPVGVEVSTSEEALTCNETLFPSSIAEIEALHAPNQETFTSLNDHISESVLSMDLTDGEDCLDVSPESMLPFSMTFDETPQADPEITPPLPPLPPTQWWIGKLVESTEMPSLEGSGNNGFYIHRDENTQNESLQATEAQYLSEASTTDGENHNSHVYREDSRVEGVSTCVETTLNEPSKAAEEQSPSAVSGTSGTYMHNDESALKCLNKTVESPRAEEVSLEADWRAEAMALEWFSQNLREHSNPHPAKLEEEPQVDRSHDSLVIGMDRSMLRKVSEQKRTQVGARADENDSLLQIIRSKSFNLRPADASVRANFQVAVPKTNVKVAAILEKANTLRQAMAGSDDEHDSDSWSE
ncbi:PREDICTED: protein SCAR4-like isoform X2 [Camelina sativa]|uniref:Protein SCAR n=1 Tax=Camelina sativa TaxID=90675 RepID=A0ABM1RFZ8_CAMSA|nr:PREDICTED: protein SCAR4-like isoform X2 [Camelina sativa]